MALTVFWTKRAENEFGEIIHYLEEEWSEQEVRNFVEATNSLIEAIHLFPELLPLVDEDWEIRRGPINRRTVLTYRIRLHTQQIELLNIHSTYRNR